MKILRVSLVIHVLTLGCLWMTSVHAASDISNAQRLKRKLDGFASETLRFNTFQNHMDTEAGFSNSDLDGSQQVSRIASALTQKFRSRFNVVEKLRDAVQDYWGSYSSYNRYEECCDVNPVEADYSFKQKVERDSLCVFGQGYDRNPQKLATNSLLDVMKSNLQNNPSIKWQYLGTEEGVISNYPAFRYCKSSYDPRFRPWYVETTTPAAKDLVIVIDTSGSMTGVHKGRTLMSIAIEAAVTVIKTLGPNDMVNVVAFASDARTPPGSTATSTCYSSQLVKATPQNKNYLVEFAEGLVANGGTKYREALHRAFHLFESSNTTAEYDRRTSVKCILFLTDGAPNDDKNLIRSALNRRNAALNNSVVILPFGLGLSSSGSEHGILQDLGQQTGYNASAGEVRKIDATWVNDPSNLRSEMASYYNFFVRTGEAAEVTVTVPYFDAFGLGLITSACLPVFYQLEHKGVVCVDISMSDLLSDVTYFKNGHLSYAFLVDNQARLLMHPYLPIPLDVESEPIFVTMTALETAPEAKEVLRSMQRLQSGNKTFSSQRVVSRGDSVHEGIDRSVILSHYHWRAVDRTKLSVCVVIGDQDKQASISWQGELPNELVYHRLDIKGDVSTCSYVGRKATKAHSAVKFAPDSFADSYRYVTEQETMSIIQSYINYFTGASNVNPGFNTGIRETVAASQGFESILLAREDGLDKAAVWTYVGFKNGAFRVLPGIQLHKRYDPTQRPWYLGALTGSPTTLSTPYEDAFGAGKVISLSKVLYEGESSGSHNDGDPVLGVMAMDFTVNYFYVMLVENFPECENSTLGCFVVDTAGFLVMHTDWYADQQVAQENEHIIRKEPGIAKQLIEANIMTRESCANYQTLKNQYFFRVSATSTVSRASFTLYPVRGTNVFVVVKTRMDSSSSYCSCTESELSGLPDCLHPAGWKCECPCQLKTSYYHYCTNQYELDSDTPPPCTPASSGHLLPQVTSDVGVSGLKPCYSTSCDATFKLYCLSVHGCAWCGSSCKTLYNCMLEKWSTQSSITTTEKPIEKYKTSVGLVAGITVGLVVLFVIVAIVACKFGRRVQTTSTVRTPEVYTNQSMDISSAPDLSHASSFSHQQPFNPHRNKPRSSHGEAPPPYPGTLPSDDFMY